MARKYVMTAKRRAALRKAQLASARKRRRAHLDSPHPSAKRQARHRKRGGRKPITRRQVRNDRIVKAAVYTFAATGVAANVATIKTRSYHSPYNRRDVVKASAHGVRGFGRGFKQGYSNARARKRQVAFNAGRMGSTTVQRVSVPALPRGGSGSSRRRVRGY